MKDKMTIVAAALCALGMLYIATSEAQSCTDYADFGAWSTAAGPNISGTFFDEGPPVGSTITNQFPDFEALDGNARVEVVIQPDRLGARVDNGSMRIILSQPATAIGFDYVNAINVQLFDQIGGALVHQTPTFNGTLFGGSVCAGEFTYVVMQDPLRTQFDLDNLFLAFAGPPSGSVQVQVLYQGQTVPVYGLLVQGARQEWDVSGAGLVDYEGVDPAFFSAYLFAFPPLP